MDITLHPATIKALHGEYGDMALSRGSMEDFLNKMAVLWVGQQREARRKIEECSPVTIPGCYDFVDDSA